MLVDSISDNLCNIFLGSKACRSGSVYEGHFEVRISRIRKAAVDVPSAMASSKSMCFDQLSQEIGQIAWKYLPLF